MDGPNMPPPTPSFLDHFILHLAAHLLGVDTVLQKLQQTYPSNNNNNNNNKTEDATVPLFYWRTKLLLDDSSCLLDGTYADDDASTKLLFLDLKISWNTQQPGLVLQWGAMISQQPSCEYIQSKPLTIQQLESHAKSVGLDLYSAPASAMASAVGRALLGQHPNAPKALTRSPHDKLQIELYYPDVEETGTLHLDVRHQTNQFDSVGMSLLYWDLTSQVSPTTTQQLPLSSNSEQHQTNPLEDAMNKWCVAAGLEMVKLQSADAPLNLSTTDDDNKPLATSVPSSSVPHQTIENTTATANNPSRVRPVPGYAQLSGTKRRKKGKLSYAKPV